MDNSIILAKVENLLKMYLNNSFIYTNEIALMNPDEMLQLLITDSKHAINFVVLLEDEFEIEIDDDDISFEFFSSINSVVRAIAKHVN